MKRALLMLGLSLAGCATPPRSWDEFALPFITLATKSPTRRRYEAVVGQEDVFPLDYIEGEFAYLVLVTRRGLRGGERPARLQVTTRLRGDVSGPKREVGLQPASFADAPDRTGGAPIFALLRSVERDVWLAACSDGRGFKLLSVGITPDIASYARR